MKRLLALLVLAAAAAMACTPSDSGSSPGVDGLESPSLTSPSLESPVIMESPSPSAFLIAAHPPESNRRASRPAVRAVRRLLCRGPIL